MSPSVSVRLLLTQSDARLVELAREGHERAFEALVQRYRRALLVYCRRLLLPAERAEDALQQGLLQAWMALQDGAEVRDVKPWLYRIVHNTALNMLRVSGYDYATLSDTLRGADAPEQDLDRRIAVREAFAGLAALPPMQREALLRTALEGHSHEEVARALGLSEGALRGLVYRARATLRAATTAFTPSPMLHWALHHRMAASAPLAARLAEMGGAGGGSVGVGALLLKGGAVVVTAGAVAGGIATVHRHAAPRATEGAADAASAPELVAQTASSDGLTSDEGQRAGQAHAGGPAFTVLHRPGGPGRAPNERPFALLGGPGSGGRDRTLGGGEGGQRPGFDQRKTSTSGDTGFGSHTGGTLGERSSGSSGDSSGSGGSGSSDKGSTGGSGSGDVFGSSGGDLSGSGSSGSGDLSGSGSSSGSGDSSGSSGSGTDGSGSTTGSSAPTTASGPTTSGG